MGCFFNKTKKPISKGNWRRLKKAAFALAKAEKPKIKIFGYFQYLSSLAMRRSSSRAFVLDVWFV